MPDVRATVGGQPAEEALREIQARRVGLLDPALDAIIIVDEEQSDLVFKSGRRECFSLMPKKASVGAQRTRSGPMKRTT